MINKTNPIKDKIFYHGNENKKHNFSEYRPSFFSEDYNYASCYGEYVYSYQINTKKPFDTADDLEALNYYNNVFLKDELGINAKKICFGEHVSFVDADNFWAFLSVEEELKRGLGYDSIIVSEGEQLSFSTNLSIIPLSVSQIKKVDLIKLVKENLNNQEKIKKETIKNKTKFPLNKK